MNIPLSHTFLYPFDKLKYEVKQFQKFEKPDTLKDVRYVF